MKKLTFGIACLLLLLLAGCLVPERFTATIAFSPDGSYSYEYAGTAVHAMAAAQIKQGKPLSAKDDAGLRAEADKMTHLPDVRRAIYKGDARYELQIDGKKNVGAQLKLMGFFDVSTGKDGVITIASPEIKDRDRQGFEKLGIKVDGTLEVKLPKNAEILSQNATSAPTFFGLVGSYSWKIGRVDQRPMMKIRLKK